MSSARPDGLVALLVRDRAEYLLSTVSALDSVGEQIVECFAQSVRKAPLGRARGTWVDVPVDTDAAIRTASSDVFGPILRAGQADGQVRADVPVSALLGWLIEQHYAARRLRLSPDQTRSWVRQFVLPCLRPDHDTQD